MVAGPPMYTCKSTKLAPLGARYVQASRAATLTIRSTGPIVSTEIARRRLVIAAGAVEVVSICTTLSPGLTGTAVPVSRSGGHRFRLIPYRLHKCHTFRFTHLHIRRTISSEDLSSRFRESHVNYSDLVPRHRSRGRHIGSVLTGRIDGHI